jgi:glycosyltransferase involved in cell wall biosynthesis
MADGGRRPKVLVVGPVPPPFFGVATATDALLHSGVLAPQFQVLHVDTSDRRGLQNFGRLDLTNVVLGLRQVGGVLSAGLRHRPKLVYLVLSHNRLGFLRDALLVFASRATGAKVVCHLRHSRYADFYDESGWVMRRIIRGTFRRCTRVLVLGERLRAMALHVDPKATVMVAPNGCADYTGGRPLPPLPRGERPRVLYLSSLGTYKGVPIVLEGARRIAKAGIEAEFVFAGGWKSTKEESAALDFIESHRLQTIVKFVGSVSGDPKTDLLLSCDILVLPSFGEGHPWAIVEAMCGGLAVIATDTGAVAETVEDGRTGFVVPVGAVDEFCARLETLVTHPSMTRAMGAEGRLRYEELFTMRRSHELVAAALHEALAED